MRRVCVFTGSRADYGPMLSVIRELNEDSDIDVRILASGGHLVNSQGLTVRQVVADGFRVDETVDMVLASDTAAAVAKSFGLGIIGYADALDRIDPDILVVLGDRYEALAVSICAALRLLPIAHIGGGELTAGSTDDSIRHAISKLAHVHFTATEESRQRVIQLGEDPTRVHNFGSPGLDSIENLALVDRTTLASTLGIELREPTLAVTYHPATADPSGSQEGVAGLLQALDRFPDSTVVFTGTNVDLGGSDISDSILEYVAKNAMRATVLPSLGQIIYLSLVRHAAVVVGNSSSGITEAPTLHTPTVNIGSRQEGRPRAASVIDCGAGPEEIERAIRRALSPDHKELTEVSPSPYGDGNAAKRIVRLLGKIELSGLPTKRFVDVALVAK